MEKTKVVVIGTGAIAKEHLKCLKKLPCAEVVGVCDLSPAKAEAASERYHISQWDTNFKDLVKRVKPDIAHVTTSAASHFTIAKELLDSGISAFVEKPITQRYHEFRTLKSLAEKNSLILLENHNYQFNPPVQKALQGIKAGEFGEMHHVEITLCLDLANSDLFTPESTHPSLKLSGGIVMEFLTHLASLTYAFLGPHTSVYTLWEKKNASSPFPYDEFRALVKANQGTASITFCSNAQPEGFWVSVYGSKMNASINLFESRLVLRKCRNIPRPLVHLSNEMKESAVIFGSALRSFWNKLKGTPGGYSGLHQLLRKTYEAIEKKQPLPITLEQMDHVNRLVADMIKEQSEGGHA